MVSRAWEREGVLTARSRGQGNYLETESLDGILMVMPVTCVHLTKVIRLHT